ncbi:MAG: tyrosine-type recombinase/integrase [Sterolibacteriaceae bacterium]|nr:tyrosine-type recombinase/integrase [Sterolibacteriaceae bacterium]
MRLDDIDWRRDVLQVRHSEDRNLLRASIAARTRRSRASIRGEGAPVEPPTEKYSCVSRRRTVHSRTDRSSTASRAPRLRAAGITPQGRKGPHAFRHAHAVSLLRAGVLLKIIGDMLGHTSAAATAEYLKLATEDLRNIGLDLPGGMLP